jgi:two-component sensor histidine kinase
VGLSPSTAAGLNQIGSWTIGNAELLALGLLSLSQILVTCCLLAMTRHSRNIKVLASTTIWWVIIVIGVIALAQIATLTDRPNGIVFLIGTMTALFAAFGTLAAFPEFAPWPISAVMPLHFSDDQSGVPNDSERLRADLTNANALNEGLQRQMKQLTRDVTHRTKNVLAVVQAIARQTAARAPGEFLENFGNRVQSLARSHDLLVKQDWRGVDLVELIHAQLADESGLIGSRILLSGPSVTLGPEATQNLALAIHELADNARKHGVLSGPDGAVSIAWHFVGGSPTLEAPAGQALSLRWTEQGGDAEQSQPNQKSKIGFGRSFLETAVGRTLDGRAKLEILPDGLVYEIVIPPYHMVSDDTHAHRGIGGVVS